MKNQEKRLIVFKLNNNVENLLSSRKISINVIWWSKNGLKSSKFSHNNRRKIKIM